MPARFLLIDGYNLMYAAGLGRQDYGPGDLQRCRERLLKYLANKLSAAEIARATVIFDARDPPPGRSPQQVFRGIRVLFANPGGDADVVIQQWLDDHSSPKRITLVSSDHVLQRAARRLRAEFVDSERFFERLERRRDKDRRSDRLDHDAKPAEELSPSEAAHWIGVFGDLSTIVTPEEPEVRDANEVEAPKMAKRETKREGGKPRRTTRKSRAGKGKAANLKRTGRISRDELGYWMEVFGSLPEARELAQGNGGSPAELESWLDETRKKKD
jgi:hypothetical protein